MVPVFGKGLLDLLDEVFWMLPFSGARQAKRVRRKAIRDEHRLPNARAELERLWKERIAKNQQLKGTEGVGAQDEEEEDVLPMAGARPAWRRSPAAPLVISNYI